MPVRCHRGMPCAVARPCVACQIDVTQMRCSCGVACSLSAIIVWPFPVGGLAAERGVDSVGEPADPTRTHPSSGNDVVTYVVLPMLPDLPYGHPHLVSSRARRPE